MRQRKDKRKGLSRNGNIVEQRLLTSGCECVTTKWQSSVIKFLPAVSEGHGYSSLFIHPRLFLALSSCCMLKHFRQLWKSVFEAAVTLTSPSTMTHTLEGSCARDGTCHEGLLSIRWMPWCMWTPVQTSDQCEDGEAHCSILRPASPPQAQQWFTSFTSSV